MDEKYYLKRIKAMIKQKGCKMKYMSLALAMNEGYISDVLRGKNVLTFQMFLKICEYLRTAPEIVLSVNVRNPERFNRLIVETDSLDDECFARVLSYVSFLRNDQTRHAEAQR